MSRMSMVYNGKEAENLTKNEIIESILIQYNVSINEDVVRAMEESFRCGFLRGEEYGKSC